MNKFAKSAPIELGSTEQSTMPHQGRVLILDVLAMVLSGFSRVGLERPSWSNWTYAVVFSQVHAHRKL